MVVDRRCEVRTDEGRLLDMDVDQYRFNHVRVKSDQKQYLLRIVKACCALNVEQRTFLDSGRFFSRLSTTRYPYARVDELRVCGK